MAASLGWLGLETALFLLLNIQWTTNRGAKETHIGHISHMNTSIRYTLQENLSLDIQKEICHYITLQESHNLTVKPHEPVITLIHA